MSKPFDRPAYGEPGGCECFSCGVIFIGAPCHTKCVVCDSDAARSAETEGLGSLRTGKHGPKGIAQ